MASGLFRQAPRLYGGCAKATKFTFAFGPERNSQPLRFVQVNSQENIVVGRSYLARQVAMLLKFAQSTKNPELAAVLIEKAADLKSQGDEAARGPRPEPSGTRR
jgi:hypothetical protein